MYEDASRSVRPIVYPSGIGDIEKKWLEARTAMFSGTPAKDALGAIKPAVDSILKANTP
jgi:hypothetical protein